MMREKTFMERSDEVAKIQTEIIGLVCEHMGEGGKAEVLKLLDTIFRNQIEMICLLDDLENGKKPDLKELSIPSFMQKRA